MKVMRRGMDDNLKLNIQIDCRNNIAFILLNGELTMDAWPLIEQQLVVTPGFVRNMNSIVDMRNMRFGMQSSYTKGIADLLLSMQIARGHGFRTAFVVGDDFTFGVCRMICVELEQVPVLGTVVRTMDDALAFVSTAGDAAFQSETA